MTKEEVFKRVNSAWVSGYKRIPMEAIHGGDDKPDGDIGCWIIVGDSIYLGHYVDGEFRQAIVRNGKVDSETILIRDWDWWIDYESAVDK